MTRSKTQERNKWLHVRVTPEEHGAVGEIAAAYNVDASTLVRLALNFLAENRPALDVRYAGKLSASGG